MTKRKRRTFTHEFKQQMVRLHENGKPRREIIEEYEMTASAFDKWVRQSQSSGSFKEKDNRSPEETELVRLRKENQRLLMENDIFKASRADHGTKVNVIRNNRHKYSVSAMCDVLQIPRSSYYYEKKSEPSQEEELAVIIEEIFHKSRQTYGTRKIKVELRKAGWTVSRRRIGRIMKEQGLVSKYTVAQFRPSKSTCNESNLANRLNREFHQDQELKVVVSDLTYVRVQQKWHYICVFVDLFNREIIGYSTGAKKDALLVYRALSSIQQDLSKIELFHTDRGNEFKNRLIDEALETFEIQRSLSLKGSPYDNAVAEAMFKVIKTEFVKSAHFESLQQLELELFDYVHWFNHIRIHSTLDYLTPVEYKQRHLKKSV
ncbi:IS3 family transposase [Mechercharimyces sp. CAU 1602]|uniref:IS3 family transposase n=1 Tax=Mechercharimyces sp. CAU 1602 TaxID=2973933 RepID=UPI0021630CEC|nr:IS3 family transposase [Mechercharimyces sp. CAU 1602]MCS1351510.1 IS3 family transposase [Mechercharimyces sp. CAU 1602]